MCAAVCSVEQRVLLLRRGLTERVPRVRAAAARMLRTWLTDQCDGDVTSLLRTLDVKVNEGALHASRLPKALFELTSSFE